MYTGVDAATDLVKAVFNIAGIVGFFVGIPRCVQLLRLSGLRAQEFPTVDQLKFAEWRNMRMRALGVLLLTVWGVFVIRWVCLIASYASTTFAGPLSLAATLALIAWVVGLVVAGVLGRKAGWLQVNAGIEWPKRAVSGSGSHACPECGARYDPLDYRDGVPEARCSVCGSMLTLGATPAADAPPHARGIPEAAGSSPGPAAWHPDPADRHELRYWDGSTWTEHVSDGGAVHCDPL
jgi:hypothetical protein